MTPQARPAFELLRFTAAPVGEAIVVVDVEGRFAASARFARRPALVVERAGAPDRRLELEPLHVETTGDRWRAAYAVPVSAMAGGRFGVIVRGTLVELPEPDRVEVPAALDERASVLAREGNALRRALERLERRSGDADERAEAAAQRATAAEERAVAAEQRAEEAEARAAAAEERVEVLQRGVGELEQRVLAADDERAAAADRIASTEDRSAAAEQRAGEAEERAAAAEQRAGEAEERAAAAEQRAGEAEERAAASEQRAEEAKGRVASAEQRAAEAEARMAAAQQRADAAERQARADASGLEVLRAELAEERERAGRTPPHERPARDQEPGDVDLDDDEPPVAPRRAVRPLRPGPAAPATTRPVHYRHVPGPERWLAVVALLLIVAVVVVLALSRA